MKFKMGGSGIHIKPENKGKFTATKKATGKSTEELTHSKNPVTKKRAIFAQNAAKWKHQDGSRKISTPDSTEYYGKQMEKFMKKRSSVRIDKAPPYDQKANKAMSDMYRQTKKGKEGYDENGHPIAKKMQMGAKNTKSFPDLNKDGKVTKADILKGRGVIKNGSKSMKADEKMCGSKGMKYAEGTKGIKFKKPMMKRADGSTSQRGLWDNLRSKAAENKKTGAKPKAPTKAMLSQEKKINSK